jgi:hypothetical protein
VLLSDPAYRIHKLFISIMNETGDFFPETQLSLAQILVVGWPNERAEKQQAESSLATELY